MINLSEFKKFFLFILIGSLIISALVAVATVLIGEFNEIAGKVLFTLLMVVVHSLITLAFIWDNEKQNTFERLAFFIDILFILIVLSFITSILGVWDIIPREIVKELYMTYFVLAFASLHGNILAKALHKETYLDIIIYLNYAFMVIVVLMLLPIIYLNDSIRSLGEIYYRFLGAAGIIDGTLSILAIIFYKLYVHKHPKVDNPLQGGFQKDGQKPEKKKGLSVWVWILIIYLICQVAFSMFYFVF